MCVADARDCSSEFDRCRGCLLQVPISLKTEVLCADQCTKKPLQPLSSDNRASIPDVVTQCLDPVIGRPRYQDFALRQADLEAIVRVRMQYVVDEKECILSSGYQSKIISYPCRKCQPNAQIIVIHSPSCTIIEQ